METLSIGVWIAIIGLVVSFLTGVFVPIFGLMIHSIKSKHKEEISLTKTLTENTSLLSEVRDSNDKNHKEIKKEVETLKIDLKKDIAEVKRDQNSLSSSINNIETRVNHHQWEIDAIKQKGVNKCYMQPTNILLVDDEVQELELLEIYLKEKGYKVTTATRYDEAKSLICKSNFDILICDEVLKEENVINEGHKLWHFLVEKSVVGNLKFGSWKPSMILITGKKQELNGMPPGLLVLDKPITKEKLYKTIDCVMEG